MICSELDAGHQPTRWCTIFDIPMIAMNPCEIWADVALSVRTHDVCDNVQRTPGYLVDCSVHATCAVLLTEMTTIGNRTSRSI